ncbi:MAG: family 20 glycosylhydrolase [Candidatus Latescibacterota bacterium]|nr:MAG: family 20 glycosylhydrolase [Candidatus Latescibacterota bacterium]
MNWRAAVLPILASVVLFNLTVAPHVSAVQVRCKTTTLNPPKRSRLEGRFKYQVQARGGIDVNIESTILVLDRSGNVNIPITINDGDEFDIKIQETVQVARQDASRMLIGAPGVLFRAEARDMGDTDVAYCSPFAAIRFDKPDNPVYGKETIRCVAGFDALVTESIRVAIDNTEVYSAAKNPATVTPYSTKITIDGVEVEVKNLFVDLRDQTLSFEVSNLPDGTHRVAVKADPVYGYSTKRSKDKEGDLRGVLKHQQLFTVDSDYMSSSTHRLVFVRRNLSDSSHVDDIEWIVQQASDHGYSGLVLSGSFDGIPKKEESDEYYGRLRKVDQVCDKYNIELIPLMFSVGYGGILTNNRHLAAALPVINMPLVVRDGVGVLTRDHSIGFYDGGFERYETGETPSNTFSDKPGTVSVIDNTVSKEGNQSLRFQNFTASSDGKARFIKRLSVQPFRCYEISCWVKTEDLDSGSGFMIQVITELGRKLMFWQPKIEDTSDWTEVRTGFNSLDADEVRIYAGVWGGDSGRFWIDEVAIREVGFLNVLRRPGTPISVRSADTGTLYEKGRDYEITEEESLTYLFDHPEPVLKTLSGGRIGNNEALLVDYFQALGLKRGSGQMGVCMSEPKSYELWREIVENVDEQLDPSYYFISGDEIRQGGWCRACQSRRMSGGELIGDCFTRQTQIIQTVNPEAKVIIWSDMLDPNHNARDNFYLFNGNIAGSWNYVPKDLIVACWRYEIHEKSLRHFEANGFRTIGCGYYDRWNPKEATDWIESLGVTRGACGIMYTTWQDKYDHLEAFGDLCR